MSVEAEEIDDLAKKARALSNARNFASSIPLLRHLSEIAPDRWDFPLDLAHDLRARGELKEGAEVLRHATPRFPEAYWLHYHCALAAFSDGNADYARQFAMGMLDGFPQHETTTLIMLGEIAVRRRNFAEAVQYFERVARVTRDDPEIMTRLRNAQLFARIEASFDIPPPPGGEEEQDSRSGHRALHDGTDYGVLAINLDHCPDQLARLHDAFRDSIVSIRRIPGVRGSYLPNVAVRALCRTPNAPRRGTTGCLLSHVAAWETVVSHGIDVCLILEDDAVPAVNLPRRFASLGIPTDFDLCFIDQRMQPELDADTIIKIDRCSLFDPIVALGTKAPGFNAPGACGYFLSKAGAHKLLALVEQDGFDGDVDWRMVIYSAGRDAAAERLQPDSVAAQVFRDACHWKEPRLKAFSLFPGLVRSEAQRSTREEENERR